MGPSVQSSGVRGRARPDLVGALASPSGQTLSRSPRSPTGGPRKAPPQLRGPGLALRGSEWGGSAFAARVQGCVPAAGPCHSGTGSAVSVALGWRTPPLGPWWRSQRAGSGAGGGASPGPPRGRAGASFVLLPARDPEAPGAPSPSDTVGSAAPPSLCGIDHEALSKQVVEYKRRKGAGRAGPADRRGKEGEGHRPPGRGPVPHELPVRGRE